MALKSTDKRIQKGLFVIETLQKEYPHATISLQFSNPLELFVAVVLSAQCTDKMVNKITNTLFEKYQTVEDYASAALPEFERIIRPLGLYHTKAMNIKRACQQIQEKYRSMIPRSMSDLLTLPGVARKTANIVLYHAYGIVEGIAVDTHVARLSRRLGLTYETNPDKIEKDLCQIIPLRHWEHVNHLLIAHGRKICNARSPRCPLCILRNVCPSSDS